MIFVCNIMISYFDWSRYIRIVAILYRINDNGYYSFTLFNINDFLDKTTKSRIENARICLARRLARLTPSQVATLFALHPGKHAGFHGIVKITTNSRFHVQNPRKVASSLVIPPRRLEWWEVPGILNALIEIQMSISRRYEHILPNERVAKREGPRSGTVAEWMRSASRVSSRCRKRSPDRAHVCSRILFGGRGSQAPRLRVRFVHQCCFIAILDTD